MDNYYKIIGTSKEAVYYIALDGKKHTEDEIDIFIKEKYEDKIKSLERKMSLATSQERREKLKEELKKTAEAYKKINSSILRHIHNRELEEQEEQRNSIFNFQESSQNCNKKIEDNENKIIANLIIRKKTAYDILNTTKETMQLRNDGQNDIVLRQKKNLLTDRYLKMLTNCKKFSDKEKIELEIQKINEAYELIKNSQKREKYNEQLNKEYEERKETIRKLKIEKQYSHKAEYNPGLIYSKKESGDKSLENKMVIRKDIEAKEHFYMDELNRKLRVKQTGKIILKNWQGCISSVNEYQVIRKIDGQEKLDTIYTNLNIANLSFDKNANKIYNPDYYNCVVNKLLSEDVIDGSKYNYGYIGEVEMDTDGNYYITLENEKLKPDEQLDLSAVITLKEREIKKQNQTLKKGKEEEK